MSKVERVRDLSQRILMVMDDGTDLPKDVAVLALLEAGVKLLRYTLKCDAATACDELIRVAMDLAEIERGHRSERGL